MHDSLLLTALFILVLAVVLDLFSCQVVGWSMQAHMQSSLVTDALRMAWFRRSPDAGVIFHSDCGSQYCGHEFQGALAGYKIRVHASTGNKAKTRASIHKQMTAVLQQLCASGGEIHCIPYTIPESCTFAGVILKNVTPNVTPKA